MKNYWFRLGSLGFAVFLVALIFSFPAAWALYIAQDRIPQQFSWEGISGSVFDASVQNMKLVLPGNRQILIGTVEIHTSILPLLVGRVALDIRASTETAGVSARATLGWTAWRILLIEGELPLAVMTELVPELRGIGISGRMAIRGSDLSGEYQRVPDSGQLTLTVEDLHMDLIEVQRSLGNYSIELKASQVEGMEGTVQTLPAPALLNIEGVVRSGPGGESLLFNGMAWVTPDAPDPVRSILPLLGVVENDRATITWRGTL